MIPDPFLNVDFEPHYYDLGAAMAFLRTIPEGRVTEGPLDFHMYWKTVRPFGRKQILPIKSFLVTQPMDFKLNLWSNTDLTGNEFLKPWLPRINFRLYDPVAEAKDTILEGKQELQRDDPSVYVGGDLFRALILHKHGGVYVDMDSVYRKSFGPLLAEEFMYKWSFQKHMISSAVMFLRQRSSLSQELLQGILELRPVGCNWGCNNNMRAFARKPFRLFPCAFFNPEWQSKLTPEELKIPNFLEPFKINPWTNEMYEGSFVWHWHNRWEEPVEPGCKFELLEKQVEATIKDLGWP